jgi:hypothetical protein
MTGRKKNRRVAEKEPEEEKVNLKAIINRPP